MSNHVWHWSDLHEGHSNLILYENRPFPNVEEQHKHFSTVWKETVGKNDTIINHGDVFFHGWNKERTTDFIRSMPGRKILIMGNHDREARSFQWYCDVGFDEVYKYPIIVEEFYILSHEPIYLNESMPYANIHGHTHSKCYDYKGYVNVSVEKINYRPILFDDIKENLKCGNDKLE